MNKLNRKQIIDICKTRGITGYSNKNKDQLIQLVSSNDDVKVCNDEPIKINRLNYIGSKYLLIDWIIENIKNITGITTFNNVKFADLFSGTGIISYYFRTLNAIILSNDAELYSSIITHAFTRSIYNSKLENIISTLNTEINENKYDNIYGYITIHYSPYNNNERKFFTIDNAKIIDYIRLRIEQYKSDIDIDEYKFLLASLLISADNISNVPAVYGCYLKNYKTKAIKKLKIAPIHSNKNQSNTLSQIYNMNILDDELINKIDVDITYLDPPYNERQYSKNYFPLNMIAKTPEQLNNEPELKGKTGIPVDCFISPFCKKGIILEESFERLFDKIKTKWLFLSYNSESNITKEKMLLLISKYGDVTLFEKEYKRFKSFEYNDDKSIKEYLFCLKKY
jgi:adenine-specific DNA-methyltransferase